MDKIINYKFTRILIGAEIGMPVTAISVVPGVQGLILLYAVIKDLKLIHFLLGIATITGFIGIFGAWKRIFTSSYELTEKDKGIISAMLIFGSITGLASCILTFASSGPEIASGIFALSFGSGVLIYATPINSNNSLHTDLGCKRLHR